MKNKQHKKIAKFYYDTEDEENYYIVFELCTGGDMHDLQKERGRIDELEAQSIFSQLAEALNAL